MTAYLKVIHAIQVAEKTEKPSLGYMFSDVYEEVPSNLIEQERSVRETIKRHPQDFPKDVPLWLLNWTSNKQKLCKLNMLFDMYMPYYVNKL